MSRALRTGLTGRVVRSSSANLSWDWVRGLSSGGAGSKDSSWWSGERKSSFGGIAKSELS